MATEKKTINTRIILRNDTLSAWNDSTKLLLKGEMALARLSGELSDKFEVRIGVGDKTWSQLSSSNFMIPVESVVGLTEKIESLSTTYYECSDIETLSDTYVNGDIAVEKKSIDDTHEQYCAYRWDGNDAEWKALDGNYSAGNVYMPENMTITYDFGKYKIESGTTSRELTCKGMTVQSFINDAFAETKQPSITNPSFSFGGRAGGTGEIGTTYTVNGATLTFNQGSYTYGPTPDCKAVAGVKLLRVAKDSVEAAEATTAEDKSAGQILSIPGSSVAVSYLSTETKYTYTYTNGFYTDSTVSAKNNIGGQADPAKCIKANTTALTGSTTASFTGYYPSYWGFTTSPKSNPTAITANNGNVTIDGITYTRILNDWSKTSFTTSNKWYELFYMVPACKRSSSGWTGKDSNNVDLAVDVRTEATLTFKDGQTAKYYIYVVRNAAQYSATTCTMTFKA